MPPALSAANRLRNDVLSVPGTVLLVQAGYPDKVIRYQRMPESLVTLKKTLESMGKNESHVTVNLDFGPAQEAWREASRSAFLEARRDRPVPEPVSVAENSHEEWSIGKEDVPIVENGLVVPDGATSATWTCQDCTRSDFNSEAALKIHRGRAHRN